MLPVNISEYPFETDFHIDGFAGDMLEVPDQFPCFGSYCQRGVGVERGILDRHAATGRRPGLRLRRAEVHQIQLGVVGSGDPDIATPAAIRCDITPGGVFRRARLCQRGGAP